MSKFFAYLGGIGADPHDDEETRRSQLSWLDLFDLLQRAGDRAAFEQLALSYVVRFERSAPAWDERVRPTVGARATSGGYVALTIRRWTRRRRLWVWIGSCCGTVRWATHTRSRRN